jgi:hypothetical protein
LAKVTVVFHSYIERAIRHQQLRQVAPFAFRSVQKVSKTIANLSTESVGAARVLVYTLVKEYARQYETLRERAAVCDVLPRTLTAIATEKPPKIVYSQIHTTLEEATERVKSDRESCSRPCVWITRDCALRRTTTQG